MNERLTDRRQGEAQWRTAYNGHASSVALRLLLLLLQPSNDVDVDEYACRVTSQNNYGWGTPSDILMFNHKDAFTSDQLAPTDGQS